MRESTEFFTAAVTAILVGAVIVLAVVGALALVARYHHEPSFRCEGPMGIYRTGTVRIIETHDPICIDQMKETPK